MLPDGWFNIKVSAVCKIGAGAGFPLGLQGKKNLPFLMIKVSDMNRIGNEKYICSSEHTIDEDIIDRINAKIFPVGSVIFPKVGAALLTNKRRLLRYPSCLDNNVMALTPSNINSDYLYYWTQTLDFSKLVQLGAVPSINNKTIGELLILYPTSPEQKQIAEVLSSVDVAIEKTKAVIEQTKKVKQGLLQELLTRGIGHTRFKPSSLGDIPETWTVVPLESIAEVERGKFTVRPRNDPRYYCGKYPFIQTGDVTKSNGIIEGYSQTLNDDGIKVSRLFPKGTIVLTIAANIGDVAILSFDAAFPDSLVGISAKDNINGLWLLNVLQRQKDYLESKATQNAQKNINLQILRPMLVKLPPFVEQQNIAAILQEIDKSISAEQSKLQSLQTIKKGLMYDLLTGKVRVSMETPAASITVAETRTVQPAFKRAILAAEITFQLYKNPKFGSVKQEKIMDLCERHLDLHAEIDRTAYRQAAGPYDNRAKRSIEQNFQKQKWFSVQRASGKGVKYLPLENCGGHKKYFEDYFKDSKTGIQSMIDLLRNAETIQCEIVATLYAAWNDFLLDGKEPDDDTIVNEILSNWHEKKQAIARDRWMTALIWMRQKNLVPHGTGCKTKSVQT